MTDPNAGVPAQLLTDVELSVPHAIAEVLVEAGIDVVFGMPGGLMMHVYDALHDRAESIRALLVRQESIATIMADVYGRLSGRPGVAIGQGAWMLGSAGTGTLEAFLSGSPMLILTEMTDGSPYSHHAPYQSGTGEWGSWDARTSFSGITKQTVVVHDGAQAVHAVQAGIKQARAGHPGPVAILFHSRALQSTVGPATRPRLYATGSYLTNGRPVPDPKAIDRGAEMLARGRAVAIAGNGVWLSGAFDELRRFAEDTGIPVATTAKGKSAIPETHPLALGVMGPFGTALANRAIAEADVILAVGTKLGASDTANENPELIDPLRQGLVQIDVEPLHAAWTYPAHQIVADAREALRRLREALSEDDAVARRRHDAPRTLAAQRTEVGYFDAPALSSDAVPILPQRAIAEIQRAATADTVVTCDAGENRIFMTHFFQSKTAGSFIQPAGVGGMGYAIPAALGVKALRPDVPVVAVCGDGGFGMSFAAMMTAIEESLPIVVVVLNNSALGWVKHEQGARVIAADLTQFDHAAVARTLGWNGVRVEHPADLAGVLSEAIADTERPTLLDVITSAAETYLTVQSPLAS